MPWTIYFEISDVPICPSSPGTQLSSKGTWKSSCSAPSSTRSRVATVSSGRLHHNPAMPPPLANLNRNLRIIGSWDDASIHATQDTQRSLEYGAHLHLGRMNQPPAMPAGATRLDPRFKSQRSPPRLLVERPPSTAATAPRRPALSTTRVARPIVVTARPRPRPMRRAGDGAREHHCGCPSPAGGDIPTHPGVRRESGAGVAPLDAFARGHTGQRPSPAGAGGRLADGAQFM